MCRIDRLLSRSLQTSGGERQVYHCTTQDAAVEFETINLWILDRILISHDAKVIFLLVWLKLL